MVKVAPTGMSASASLSTPMTLVLKFILFSITEHVL